MSDANIISDFWANVLSLVITFCFLIPLMFKVVAELIRCRKRLPLLIVLAAAAIGADKGPINPQTLYHAILVVLAGGGLLDPTGTVATKTEAETLAAFRAETGRILEGSRSTLSNLVESADGITTNLEELSVAYVAVDWPRAIPGVKQNHNVSAVIEKTEEEDGGTNIAIYVWFSEGLASAPLLSWKVQTAPDEYVAMESVTNTFPQTFQVRENVRCVKYVCAMPEAVRGMAIRPGYELEWGGPDEGDYLGLSEFGVSVTDTNDVEHLPFTGVRTLEVAGTNLYLGITGGICTCAKYAGVYYWGLGECGTTNLPSHVATTLGGIDE